MSTRGGPSAALRPPIAGALSVLSPLLLYAIVLVVDVPVLDEEVHRDQVRLFASGELSQHPRLPIVPGLHGLAAAVVVVTGVDSMWLLRLFGVAAAVAAIALFRACARELRVPSPELRAAQLAVFPVVAPLFPLFYTDVASLALLLLALLCTLRQRHRAAAVALLLALLVRQDNVVWLPLFLVLAARPARGTPARWPELLALASPALAFAALVAIHGEIALGDRAFHPSASIHGGNAIFGLALAAGLLLPTVAAGVRAAAQDARARPLRALGIVAIVAGLAAIADADHPFNRRAPGEPEPMLYNHGVRALLDCGAGRLAGFVAGGVTALSLASVRWAHPALVWVLPLWAIRAAGSWLVEPRYAIFPLVVLLLGRPAQSRSVERALLVLYAAATLTMTLGMAFGRWVPL